MQYLGAQDTFYVGTLKGVGRIYQQTYIDTYAKTAQAKLYTTKTPITAADEHMPVSDDATGYSQSNRGTPLSVLENIYPGEPEPRREVAANLTISTD